MDLPAPLAIQAADRLLGQDNPNSQLLHAIARRCRQVGALDHAHRLYQRVLDSGHDAYVEAVVSTLRGDGLPAGFPVGRMAPAPFIRLTDILPADALTELRRVTSDALGDFVPSLHNDDGRDRLDLTRRVSAVLNNSALHVALFRPLLAPLLQRHRIAEILRVELPTARQEIQVTCSGNGAFFKPHTDSGFHNHKTRRLTFVYYFHFEPKQFTGGNLLLFDANLDEGKFDESGYTAIEPTGNSIVFFPSTAVHEVELVHATSNDLQAGRFTINGWIHA